jgi:hypothetical protein
VINHWYTVVRDSVINHTVYHIDLSHYVSDCTVYHSDLSHYISDCTVYHSDLSHVRDSVINHYDIQYSHRQCDKSLWYTVQSETVW